jgi:hypothetical protein
MNVYANLSFLTELATEGRLLRIRLDGYALDWRRSDDNAGLAGCVKGLPFRVRKARLKARDSKACDVGLASLSVH